MVQSVRLRSVCATGRDEGNLRVRGGWRGREGEGSEQRKVGKEGMKGEEANKLRVADWKGRPS